MPNRNMLRWQIAIGEYRVNKTILHKDGKSNKNLNGLRISPLPNDTENPAYLPEEVSPKIPIEGISDTDQKTTFFDEVRNSYTQDNNARIPCQLHTKSSEDNSSIEIF
ncbi:hypothetical protein O181_039889 [Austropuccinia psidii MF-1]|uniref:Uncharacterized protein n=1 Tax=Austropuccinia psidii MF-1 TaxID=1389203 RepID=A0A9Q3DBB9_9BASI|nr:hypothetical protein [Austropuccinia psidii MF-1]